MCVCFFFFLITCCILTLINHPSQRFFYLLLRVNTQKKNVWKIWKLCRYIFDSNILHFGPRWTDSRWSPLHGRCRNAVNAKPAVKLTSAGAESLRCWPCATCPTTRVWQPVPPRLCKCVSIMCELQTMFDFLGTVSSVALCYVIIHIKIS